jgi:hypothetical protein
MSDKNPFTDKRVIPDTKTLEGTWGNTFSLWLRLEEYTCKKYPQAIKEWNYPGEKYGWSYRIKDKKRVIIYLLPRNNFFKVGMVFGQKAFEEIMKSQVSEKIKGELQAAKVYAEGRGIRIDVKSEKVIEDIRVLIDIKLAS